MNWLNNAWYVAAVEDELIDAPFVARRLLDKAILLWRTSDGVACAVEDMCPHRLLPLSMGRRFGDEMQCGYHGLRFATDGRCTLAPGQSTIPPAAHLKTFPLELRHGLWWIWMGERDSANPELIPDMRWYKHPEWAASKGVHRLEADFRLSVDNLMDLGHESWVHLRTIGNQEEEAIPNYPLKVDVIGNAKVRAHREMPNVQPAPFFEMIMGEKKTIHRWQTALSIAPSICMTDTGVYPVGTAPEKAYRGHVLHMLTPETERSTHYFWAFARNYRIDDEQLTVAIHKEITNTFDEDAVVLRAQQRQLDLYGKRVPNVPLRVDAAPIRTRHLLEALVAREASEPTFVYQPPLIIEEGIPELAMS